MKSTLIFIASVLVFTLISCNQNNQIITNTLPDLPFLDSVADAHSDELYYWTKETIQNEKCALNDMDLAIKVNRKVSFTCNGRKFNLYPFFLKLKSANKTEIQEDSKIFMLHFLLLDSKVKMTDLKAISSKDLKKMFKDQAYYFYE